MKKSKRILIAKDTLEVLKRGYYETESGKRVNLSKAQKYAEQHTKVYRPDELSALLAAPSNEDKPYTTSFVVNDLSSLNSVREEASAEENLICLNFASARNPGGGFLKGSQAQEESIARASGLYPCQLRGKPYYLANRAIKTCLYTDHMIYSPQVPIFREEDGTLMDDFVKCSFLTTPAVNAGVIKRNEPAQIQEIEPRMRQRMDMVLAICRALQYNTLILGAWGCGVFENDPILVAEMFHEQLTTKYKGAFQKVVFSIYSKDERFITPFQEKFQ